MKRAETRRRSSREKEPPDFAIMPSDLTGVPSTFQGLMDVVTSGLNLEVCLLYLNDIIVYSADVDTHLE